MYNNTKRIFNMFRNLFNLGLINALRTWSSDCKKTTQGIKMNTINSQNNALYAKEGRLWNCL